MKFPEKLQTLEEELEDEDDSEWAERELNHYTEQEDKWRDRIATLEGNYSAAVQAENRFLGGKQVQRAIQFFREVMIESLPDPYELRDVVPSVTGYLGSGLNRENWERAMVQITKVCVKEVSHPGINFLIKHVGSIFRRLFTLALDDVKCGEEFSSTFKLLPNQVEKHLVSEFDHMLWTLMEYVASQTHCSLEPMYSTVDPNLPTFHPTTLGDHDDDERYELDQSTNTYNRLKTASEKEEESWIKWTQSRLNSFVAGSGERAKEFLRNDSVARATSKKSFLPDERTSMVTNEETDKIIQRSFEYIVALMEFNLVTLNFQLNHYLYEGFKTELSKSFQTKLINDADWEKLVEPDPSVAERLEELKGQIAGLSDSLHEVERMQRKML
jgi:hypothetical protein